TRLGISRLGVRVLPGATVAPGQRGSSRVGVLAPAEGVTASGLDRGTGRPWRVGEARPLERFQRLIIAVRVCPGGTRRPNGRTQRSWAGCGPPGEAAARTG